MPRSEDPCVLMPRGASKALVSSRLIASAREGRSLWVRRQSSTRANKDGGTDMMNREDMGSFIKRAFNRSPIDQKAKE